MQVTTYEISSETKSLHTINVFGDAEIIAVSNKDESIVLHVMQNPRASSHKKYIELVLSHQEMYADMCVAKKYIGMTHINSVGYIYVFERLYWNERET
jgi:hypothetical protein